MSVLMNSFKSVTVFNDIAGNLDVIDANSIRLQLGFILSEVNEAIEALDNGDAGNLLKEACDISVTTLGLLAKLQGAKFNVPMAMVLVDNNNMDKFVDEPSNEDLNNPDRVVEYNEAYNVYVIKDKQGKIRKPSTYKEIDVSEYAPKDFLKGGGLIV